MLRDCLGLPVWLHPWASPMGINKFVALTGTQGTPHPPYICYAMSTAILSLRVIDTGIKPTCRGRVCLWFRQKKTPKGSPNGVQNRRVRGSRWDMGLFPGGSYPHHTGKIAICQPKTDPVLIFFLRKRYSI